jgi:hypothetical protein
LDKSDFVPGNKKRQPTGLPLSPAMPPVNLPAQLNIPLGVELGEHVVVQVVDGLPGGFHFATEVAFVNLVAHGLAV